jgi:glycosyltransferase involved in cell wall biosynthesis
MKIGILRPPGGVGGAETSMIELYLYFKNKKYNTWINFDIENKDVFKDFIDLDVFSKRFNILTNETFSENFYKDEVLLENIKNTDVFFILQYRILNDKIKKELINKKNINIYVPGKNSIHVLSPLNDNLNIDHFIFNSKETLDYHLSLKYSKNKDLDLKIKNKFIYLHPPLNLEYYLKINNIDYKKYRLENFNIPTNEFSIGVIGRIQPSKAPFDAIDIFKSIEKKYNYSVFPRKLYFIGDGEVDYIASVKEYILKLNIEKYINITGIIPDANFYIKSMDSILHCCKMESLSRSLRESMMLKKPVIAYNNFGNKNLFILNDIKKFLFLNNVEAANQLIKLGTNGSLKKHYSNVFFKNINLLENNKNLDYYNFLKKYE